jgi:hypothetical protein
MLGKLIKYDLKWILKLILIYCFLGIFFAVTGRLFGLIENSMFFDIISKVCNGISIAMLINAIVNAVIRGWVRVTYNLYKDESYLTHTLPVTKNQLINSKYLTALIEIVTCFACLIISLLIMYAGPSFTATFNLLISSIVTEKVSTLLTLTLFAILVIVEFLMFISIIDFSIVIGFKSRDRRILKSFLITVACSIASALTLLIIMFIVLSINGVKLTSTTLILSKTAFYSVMLTGIITYSVVIAVFYFLTKHHFNKGVNVD